MQSAPSAVVRLGRVRRSWQDRSMRLQRWWLDQSVRAKGTIVVAVPLIALIAITSASLVLQHTEEQERQVALTASALQVLADAVSAETGLWGYAATANPLFLQPYNLAVLRIGVDRAALRSAAVAEGDSGAERVAEATTVAEMTELADLRTAINAGASATVLTPALENGKSIMNALQSQISALSQGPAAIVTDRRIRVTQLESTIDTVSIVGLALGVLAGLIGIALFTS